MGHRTYNESATLVFLSLRELANGLNDLDTCVSVDVNVIIVGATERSINNYLVI